MKAFLLILSIAVISVFNFSCKKNNAVTCHVVYHEDGKITSESDVITNTCDECMAKNQTYNVPDWVGGTITITINSYCK